MLLRARWYFFVGFIIAENYADGSRLGGCFAVDGGEDWIMPRPLVRPSEAGGFGLGDGGGVEFAVGWVYDGFVVVDFVIFCNIF